ncbi:phage protein NinX family protein [Citrobacter amalonaticus]|uniref:phage protein NinX family protein n=1 Tax=Citrobacter amalonaticus TaxID=35703 RepID=UPI00356917EB
MDYSQLSDAEIAQKVWFWWNQNIEHDNTLCGMSGGKMLYVKNSVWTAFDPCNNPADAWPIIQSNGISLVKYEHGMWLASCDAYWVDGVEWQIDGEAHPNPLRAAMIVFLMMQDANHA